MTHVSDDVLAAVALGYGDVDDTDLAHVADCPVCALEVAELTHIRDLMRGLPGDLDPVVPSPQVWDRIAVATASSTEDAARSQRPDSVPPSLGEPPRLAMMRSEDPAPGGSTPSGRAGRSRDGRPGPPRRAFWLVGVAAACLLVGALVGRAVTSAGDSSAQVIAATTLTTLDAARQPEGTAQLLDERGAQELRIEANPMSAGAGYLEVWLINADGKRMVSLGVLSGTQATFPVPAGAVAQGYTIVDVSREQLDDKPQHSGDSVMRGTLPA